MFSVETIGRWTEKKIILDGVVVHRLPLRWQTVTAMKSDAALLVCAVTLAVQGRMVYFWRKTSYISVHIGGSPRRSRCQTFVLPTFLHSAPRLLRLQQWTIHSLKGKEYAYTLKKRIFETSWNLPKWRPCQNHLRFSQTTRDARPAHRRLQPRYSPRQE
jgi:hypothetical protein